MNSKKSPGKNRQKNNTNINTIKVGFLYFTIISMLIIVSVSSAANNGVTGSNALSDYEKQMQIKSMVDTHRGSIPTELILSIIRQEGGEGAFHVSGWLFNSFYSHNNAPWAQPTNGDGIMQVTINSGYHEKSGSYTHTQIGYSNGINDGCGYLQENLKKYGTLPQTVLHYNTGPNSLYIYLGNNWGDRNYLSNVASRIKYIETIYGISNPKLVDQLNQGQKIVNEYLYNKGLKTGQSSDYYAQYQKQLDTDLSKISTGSTIQNTVRLTLYMHDGSSSGSALPGVRIIGNDAKGVIFDRITDSNGAVILDGIPGTWQFTASKPGYPYTFWTNEITNTQIRHGYLKRQ